METILSAFLGIAGAGLLIGTLLLLLQTRETKRFAFVPASLILGVALGFVLSKVFYLLGTLGNPISIYGLQAFWRLEPPEFSFFGGALGYVLGVALAARLCGLPVREMLDRFALPGCVMVACFRFATLYLAEIGLGEFARLGLPEVEEGSALAFFPLSVEDGWGGWWLAVATPEALAALLCGLYAWLNRQRFTEAPGQLFARTCVLLCACQVFLELLHSTSIISYFVHAEQLWCALYILIFTLCAARALSRREKGFRPWLWPIAAFVSIALNGVIQFLTDKPYGLLDLLPEGAANWLSENLAAVSILLILLCTAALAIIALQAANRAVKAGWMRRGTRKPN